MFDEISTRYESLPRICAERPLIVLGQVLLAFLSIANCHAIGFGYRSPVALENSRPGTAAWILDKPASKREIEGYASLTSVNAGKEIKFYVNTASATYDIEIFRTGWYQGLGARKMFGPLTRKGTKQVTPIPDPESGLVDCKWTSPYTLQVPSTWVSGVYLARLTERARGKQSYILFVVRNDAHNPEALFVLPVTTYQAYNYWGGKSLYDFGARAWDKKDRSKKAGYKVSFNRPYAASTDPTALSGLGAGEYLTNLQRKAYAISKAGWNYNLVRWLEKEGYDVGYITSIDAHTRKDLFTGTKALLFSGHDEYWSWSMRKHVQTARDMGVNLMFLSSNTAYWQIRLTGGNRTMVAYKQAARKKDPAAIDQDPTNDYLVTARWRDSPVNKPEAELIGVEYFGAGIDTDIVITNPSHWVYMNSGVTNGRKLLGLLGYEVDRVSPSNSQQVEILAESPVTQLDGSANMTIYQAKSGALVFATGSMQWSWGLDDYNAPRLRPSRLNPIAETVTRNVLARFLM